MFDFLRDFSLEVNSFWIGFIIGSIFWWLLNTLRPYFRIAVKALGVQIGQVRESMTTGTEIRLANDTLHQVQGLHLAAPLFSLDEIRIEPHLLAPPISIKPGEDMPPADIISETLPYTPDWPELAGVYGAKSFTIPQAMSNGANLIVMGKPGTGKTFALADLASKISRRDPAAGDLADLIPLYLNVFDLDPDLSGESEPLTRLTQAVLTNVSTLTARQLPKLLQSAFNMGRVIVLFDGLDELPPEEFDTHVSFLEALLADHPNIRLVVSASMEYVGGLHRLGLSPMPIAAWSESQKRAFLARWTELWIRFVNPEIWPAEPVDESEPGELGKLALPPLPVDPLMIHGWILNDVSALNPLELTLKVWSAFAGDMLGRRPVEALEAYLRRMTANLPTARPALEKLAFTMANGRHSKISRNEVDALSGSLPVYEDESQEGEPLEDNLEGRAVTTTASQVSVRRVLPRLEKTGLVRVWDGGQVSFSHPVVMGYLTGSYLVNPAEIDTIYSQPDWSGRDLALKYLVTCGDASPLAVKIMEDSSEPLQDGLLTLGSWLGDAPKSDNWRALVMRRLAKLVQNDLYPLSIRGKALSALAISADGDVAVLFRHLLNSDKPQVRQLAALGAGFIRDREAVNELAVKLYDPSPSVCRAACLALVNIGGDDALEQTASALLHGDEDLRRAAAEAFANHPEEGHPMLRDGAQLDDLLVRRAIVFGLQRVKEKWAIDLLKEIQVGDEQWVVRNAATQALEELERPDPCLPTREVPLHEVPWLIAFAGERGLGVSAGKPAEEMLKLAVKEGNAEIQMAAMDQIHRNPDSGMVLALFNQLYGSDTDLREAAYNTLWQLNVEGIELPSPAQFGFGS